MSLDKENPAVRPFPPFCLPISILPPPDWFWWGILQPNSAKLKRRKFYTAGQANWQLLAILGNHPIIVSTCCSTLFLKSCPTAALHSNTAELLSDDTLLHCPPPAEVQKACQGNPAATRLFLTWFYMLIPKGRSSFPLPYVHQSSFHFALAPPAPLPFLPPHLALGESRRQLHPWAPLSLGH